MISKDKAIEVLKNYVKEGDSLFTTLNHVSQSGMMRHISVIAIDDNKPINLTRFVSVALDWKEGKNKTGGGVKVGGCGMDMGFHLIYTLSRFLFDDGYAVKQEWI
tara:strand:+ start:359 stop:673 length:315 start_codon:yes stop_codon:yes gene_type:complete